VRVRAQAKEQVVPRPHKAAQRQREELNLLRYGLELSIRAGLLTTATGSVAILLVSLFSPTFLPFLCAMCVFLFGMAIVSPLGTAQALSPFGEKAGAASALLGFWQMMNAAAGVWLAATLSHEPMFALGTVLTIFSLAALCLYGLKQG
jgi:DHA1 family bicyclomycin/chloramphenicol resistance-like MFS transporter